MFFICSRDILKYYFNTIRVRSGAGEKTPHQIFEFYEFDNEKDAQEYVDFMYSELDAQITARDLDWTTMEAVSNVLLGSKVSSMTVAEIKRDMMLYAKTYPQDFMEAVNDPSLRVNNIAARALSDGYLSFRNNKKEIFYLINHPLKSMLTAIVLNS